LEKAVKTVRCLDIAVMVSFHGGRLDWGQKSKWMLWCYQ